MHHDTASIPILSKMDKDQDETISSNDDILSAALCAAGLGEFFVAVSTEDSDQQQPSTSTTSPLSSLSPAPTTVEVGGSRMPLPGITASASTSPDLPINAASQENSVIETGGVPSTVASNQPQQPSSIKNAKLIRIMKPDGKTVFLQVGSAASSSITSQAPTRLVVATRPAAPILRTGSAVKAPTIGPRIGAASVGIGATLAPAIVRRADITPSTANTRITAAISPSTPRPRPPAPPLFHQQSSQQSLPSSTQTTRPLALGRSRLLPAVVTPSQVRPNVAPPRPPPTPSSLPKRSRLVHFNPTSPGIPARAAAVSTSARIEEVLHQPYPVDHDKPIESTTTVDSGMALVGPMRPLTAATPRPPVQNTTSSLQNNELKPMPPARLNMVAEHDEDEEDLGLAETYSDYIPAKLRSGLSHPDQVVETSSLSSVLPPDIHYHCTIPEDVVDTGKLSALQFEAVIYACQKTETLLPSGERAGYLIGDGPGVGKGRTIAAFIFENYLLGRKRALWFSVSSDLKYDAERDLRDIGAGKIKVYSLNKFKYAKISGKENGSIKKGVIFATYASLIGESNSAKSKYRSRLKQLLQWCGQDFDGVIVFDECHRAKNLVPIGSTKPTKTGQAVLQLQNALPKGRVLYASATGATETRNMAYMTRLGLWGVGKPFKDFSEFIAAVEKRGVGAMEVVAMDMKLRGLYLARQLSFSGVTFRIEEVPLSEDFIRMYDESVKLWLEARKQFRLASDLIDPEKGQKKSMWSQFWAAHQRFFKYLCIAAKVKECVRMVRENIKNGKCVVIGLQSTGEARTLDQLEEMGGELTDFLSTAKGVFQSLVEKHFPCMDDNAITVRSSRKQSVERSLFWTDDMDDIFGDMKTGKGTWKRKLVVEHREKKKMAKLERMAEEEDDDDDERSSSSSENSGEESDNDSENEGSDHGTDGSKSSDNDQSSHSGSDDDDDEQEEVEDTFNPFADDAEEADPWESKILDKTSKRKKKRRKLSVTEERDEELERQLEQALQEVNDTELEEQPVTEVKQERLLPSFSASDFLASSSTYMDTDFKPGRFATELGLDKLQVMKAELLAAVERLGEVLPPNTLDHLIDQLGGPEYVAEMTGRKGRVVSRDDGEILYELRNDDCDVPLELLNIAEREKFMDGAKHIAIISEAASSGISLQSDRRAKNQRRRVHITLELPWSADKAIQQFGRTHRSNQVSAPEYVFLISELAGEYRFASIVAKRLESLGALTHGDRRATESRDLSQFNLDTKYGRAALDITLKSIVKQVRPLVKPPVTYVGDFFVDMRQYLDGVGILYRDDVSGTYFLEKDTNLAKFLNRLLGLPVMAQNTLFQYFSDTLREVVEQAKRDFRYDLGIMDIGHGDELVKKVQTVVFFGKFETGSLKTELHTVMVERGMSWNAALDLYKRGHGSKTSDGFYISSNVSLSPTVVLACDAHKRRADSAEQLYHIYRPNVGLSQKLETITELKQRFKKVTPEKAEIIWMKHFDASALMCQHEYWFGRCRTNESTFGVSCDVGRRKRAYHILAGSVLGVWNTVEDVLSSLPGRRQNRMQVVRLRTDKGQKIVGILIPSACKKVLADRLGVESYRTCLEDYE